MAGGLFGAGEVGTGGGGEGVPGVAEVDGVDGGQGWTGTGDCSGPVGGGGQVPQVPKGEGQLLPSSLAAPEP